MANTTKREKEEQRRLEWQEKQNKEKRNILLKKVAIWTGVTLIFIVSVVGLLRLATSTPSTGETIDLPVVATDLIKGNREAKVTLIEYSDFQCPACASYQPIVKQLSEEYKDRVSFVYRNFPLRAIHKNAGPAAQSAYAASLQGKFWEYHDLLFENQTTWAEEPDPKALFEEYAQRLDLDMDKFKEDLNSTSTQTFIRNQEAQGNQIGVNSTPTFFLNGARIQNPRGIDEFKALIDNELNKE